MSYSDGHAVCTSDVGVVRHADLVETRLGEVGGEGGGLLSLSLLHVVEVALAHEGRGVHGMLPLPDQFGEEATVNVLFENIAVKFSSVVAVKKIISLSTL